MRRRTIATIVAVTAALAAVIASPAVGGVTVEPDTTSQYVVNGPRTWADRNDIAQTGAAIDFIEHGKIYVTATQRASLRPVE